MDTAADPYTVLGLAPTADDVVVRAAWKALLRKHHPDINLSDPSGARAREINEAFAILGKPESRAAYDRTRVTRPPATPRPAPIRPSHIQTAIYFCPTPRRRRFAPRLFPVTLSVIAAVPLAGVALLAYPDTSPATHHILLTYGAGIPLVRKLVDRLDIVMPVPANAKAAADLMPDIVTADQDPSRHDPRHAHARYAFYAP